MSKEQDNKAIVGRWFTDFWGKTCNLGIVDELAAPDMLLQYSLHEPRRGRADIKAFMTDFRKAFPDLNFWGTADLIAEGDYVVGRWEGGGTHTGPAFSDFLIGSLPAATGRKMHFTGTTVLRLQRQDRRGNRPGRWRHGADAAGPPQGRLTEKRSFRSTTAISVAKRGSHGPSCELTYSMACRALWYRPPSSAGS